MRGTGGAKAASLGKRHFRRNPSKYWSRLEAVQGLTEEGAPRLVLCGALGYGMHLHWTQPKRDIANDYCKSFKIRGFRRFEGSSELFLTSCTKLKGLRKGVWRSRG